MHDKLLRILLIDDNPSVVEEVQNGLQKIGVPIQINYQCPLHREERFGGCQLPVGPDFDGVDLALIDLELFPPLEFVSYSPGDLRGGTEILPYLRREAPWIPVIAYSKLFRPEAAHFLTIACGFGFDGHTTRGMFSAPWFTRELWDGLLSRAYQLRRKAVLGEEFAEAGQVELELPAQMKARLDAKLPAWSTVARHMFFFSKKVVMEAMQGGWSGAEVLRTYVRQRPEDGGREGEWVWKVSSSPWKAHREVQAHLRMVREGLPFARIVPLLWHSVVVEHGVAAIAYQFAHGTQEASTILQQQKDLKALSSQLTPMFQDFYRDRVKDRGIVRNVLADWCPKQDDLLAAAAQMPGTAWAAFLTALAENKDVSPLSTSVEYQRCRVHGDLHLGNIMLGAHNVFIDFALSKVGPVAVDMAKLITDILLRVPTFRTDCVPKWSDTVHPMMQALAPIRTVLHFTPGDDALFQILLMMHLARALNYDDVPTDAKEWAKRMLERHSESAFSC